MPSNKNHFNEQLQEPHHFRLNVVSSIHNNNNALVWVCRFVCGQKTEGMECFVVVLECVRAPPVSGFVCVRVKVKHLASLWGATLAPFGTVRPIDNVDRVDSLINHHRHNDLLLKWKVRTPFFFLLDFKSSIYWKFLWNFLLLGRMPIAHTFIGISFIVIRVRDFGAVFRSFARNILSKYHRFSMSSTLWNELCGKIIIISLIIKWSRVLLNHSWLFCLTCFQ